MIWAKARILNRQNDLYHIGQNAATTLATGCYPTGVVRIIRTHLESENLSQKCPNIASAV